MYFWRSCESKLGIVGITKMAAKCVERTIGSQSPPACCHASHILFYYIEDSSP